MCRLVFTGLLILLLAACSSGGVQGHTAPRKIALTFDDAPRGQGPVFSGEERAEKLIATLKSANIPPVAFFITTRGLDKEEGRARVRSYAHAGHLIANHSDTHQWAHKAGFETVMAEIDTAETKLTGFANRRYWFRFPYLDEGRELDLRDNIRVAMKNRGLFNGYVTVDNYDWYLERKWKEAEHAGRITNREALKSAYIDMLLGAVQFYDAAAVEAFGETVPHVLLLHENDLAALFAGDLVEALRTAGWEVISPDEAYAHPVAARLPQTLRTGSGHVAALAIDGGRSPKTFDHLAINEEQLDAFLLERAVFGPVP